MFRSVRYWAALAAVTVLVSAVAWAADATATGKWNWKQRLGPNGDEAEITLELKQDGEKLTGTWNLNDIKVEIKDGTVKDGNLAFVVMREFDGNQIKTIFKGKQDADTIKGTRVITINGEERMLEWIANRAK